jgi:hypothetical protein
MSKAWQRLLDGAQDSAEVEALLASLPEAERLEARRMLGVASAAAALPGLTPAPEFQAQVMARVRARARPRRSAWTWLRTPRLSPLAFAAGAALVAAATLGLSTALLVSPAPQPELVVARLAITAPQARQVAVAGDFNGWSTDASPLRRAPNGAWSTEVSLPRGRHQYMFVVDGTWTPDPAARATVDDGFGNLNAILDL